LARMRVLVDVGQALLDDAIDVRRRRRRQHAQVAVDLEGYLAPARWRRG
jgi:hypothetical protein